MKRFFLHLLMFQFAILNCISSAPDEGGAGEAYSEGNFALILAEQEFEGSPAAASLMVTGLFLHYRGMPFDGIAQFFKIPLPPASMQAQIDACENSPMKDDPRETIEDGFLELLDAGALSIRLDSETRSLVSRPFPDIVANIVGSIYQAELSDGTGGIPPQRPSFEIESTGSAEVGGFSASVEMPSSFKFTSV
ncbi:MAG: hypothetical protein FJ088_04645, partial [Deltaproteobacteria bacterium]|nr:hypothetical protein [Deltaproteobacteria bacterium]